MLASISWVLTNNLTLCYKFYKYNLIESFQYAAEVGTFIMPICHN